MAVGWVIKVGCETYVRAFAKKTLNIETEQTRIHAYLCVYVHSNHTPKMITSLSYQGAAVTKRRKIQVVLIKFPKDTIMVGCSDNVCACVTTTTTDIGSYNFDKTAVKTIILAFFPHWY